MTSLKTYARSVAAKMKTTPAGRRVLSYALPVFGRFSEDGVRTLRFKDGWIHEFAGLTAVEPDPRLRAYHLRGSFNQHIWGSLYAPKPGDVVIDVGAGVGSETLYYADMVGPTGRVISIEAHPAIFKYVAASIALNGFSHVTALNMAVADKPGVLAIENDLEHHLGNRLTNGGGLEVKADTLDSVVEQAGLSRVDFLKMNIEGAERLALPGMTGMIERTAIVSISCHDFKYDRTGDEFFRTRAIVKRFVEDRGFVVVERQSPQAELATQVNAWNPKLVDLS